MIMIEWLLSSIGSSPGHHRHGRACCCRPSSGGGALLNGRGGDVERTTSSADACGKPPCPPTEAARASHGSSSRHRLLHSPWPAGRVRVSAHEQHRRSRLRLGTHVHSVRSEPTPARTCSTFGCAHSRTIPSRSRARVESRRATAPCPDCVGLPALHSARQRPAPPPVGRRAASVVRWL